MNKTNICTEFQIYWYSYSTCFGQLFCPSSGVLSRTSAKNSWWWAERLPETSKVVLPNKIWIQCICWFYLQGIWRKKLFIWEVPSSKRAQHTISYDSMIFSRAASCVKMWRFSDFSETTSFPFFRLIQVFVILLIPSKYGSDMTGLT